MPPPLVGFWLLGGTLGGGRKEQRPEEWLDLNLDAWTTRCLARIAENARESGCFSETEVSSSPTARLTPAMATSAIDRLSPELLHILFVHLDSPAAFSQVRRSWYATSKDPYSISQYLLAHYAKHEVLSVAISYGPVATPQVFRPLLAAGAVFSRYFAVTLQLRFAGISTDRILWRAGDKWGTRWNLSVQTFAVLMQLAEERWGTLPRSLAGLEELTAWDAWQLNAMAYHGMLVNERAEDMLALVNASPQGMGGLRLKVEVLWGEIAVLVEKCASPLAFATPADLFGCCRFSFVCFRRDDRLYNTLARGVLLEPRLLPLLQRNGWDYTGALRAFNPAERH